MNHLLINGELNASDDIPESFGIAQGLTGIALDCDGSVLRLLNVFLDGSFYVLREDVVNDLVIKVDQTSHFISESLLLS